MVYKHVTASQPLIAFNPAVTADLLLGKGRAVTNHDSQPDIPAGWETSPVQCDKHIKDALPALNHKRH